MLTNAQTINNGLYVNEERNEFVIVKNDTVQFRYYNDDALASFTLGDGVLKMKGKNKFIIQPSSSFLEKTSVIFRHPRSDDKLCIQFFAHDGLPIVAMNIKISRLHDKNKNILNGFSDIWGQWLLDEKLIDYFDKKDVLIHATLVGYTEIEKRILLERGYDYIIRTRIPDIVSGGVARGNKNKIEIRQLGEDEISIGRNTVIKLKKIDDDYPCFDFPFDMDVKNLKNRND